MSLDVGLTEGIPFVVTEHVGGTPFDVYCRAGSLLDGPRLAEQLAAAATGLEAAHRAGVVHGDLRPDRLLGIESVVKVCGFGRGAALPTDLQRSHYQSPEQVRREELDGRSDVFSLGTVMYEMLSGRQAFEGESSSTVLYRVVNEDVRDPRELDTAVHDALAEIVMRALAKRRRDRFEHIGQMALALQEASVALGVDARIESDRPPDVVTAPVAEPPPGATRAVPDRKAPSGVRLRPFLLGTLLIAFLVVAGLSLLREGDEGPGPAEQWLEARVRTEPPGVLLSLDGEPLTPGEEGAGALSRQPAVRRASGELRVPADRAHSRAGRRGYRGRAGHGPGRDRRRRRSVRRRSSCVAQRRSPPAVHRPRSSSTCVATTGWS